MDNICFMREALAEAEKAAAIGEIPVGAVIVKDGKIVGRGHNLRTVTKSPLDHAEIVAMKNAAEYMNSWRFDGCTVYVTLEPCVMCSGAIVQSRMKRIVYGAKDPRGGGAGSLYDIPSDSRMYHTCEVIKGVLASECSELLISFFRKRRNRDK